MSERGCRQVRKEFNALKKSRAEVARDLIEELEKAPFRFRFRFAIKLLFHRKK